MVWRSSSDLSTLLLHLLLCNLRLIFECAKTDPLEQSFDAVRKEIAQIQFLCSEMEPLWRSISAKSQRDIWKRCGSKGQALHDLNFKIRGYPKSVDQILPIPHPCRMVRNQSEESKKVEQVAEEAESLKASLDKYNLRHQWRMQEARERAELIERSNGDSSHVLRIFGYEAQAMQSTRRKKPWQRVWPFCPNIVSKGIV
ncbi:putative ethanolamine-phosphate cytidylyltransferase isoform 1 [Capsicum annuum]|uniref:Uncharacterized protein n=1 Tax=Capsicum annuum TaxID=4072 RepID=A0A2G2Z326_CAPAN|nr:putative ethanolamine-phosphate cytidylyltransferase isoform 1 [Capsicum annuum]PHT76265.1 hypothetical protein T459_19787 [Capsicum annuum]